MKLPARIPKRFWVYFWDVDPKKLDPREKPFFVIQRMLDKGNTDCVRWVCQNFPKATIIKTFKTMRDFSPWTGNFWSLVLDVPKNEMLCLREPYLSQRRTLWPY